MTESQIITAIRQGIREPKPKTVSDDQIQSWIADAVRALGLEIKKSDQRYFEKVALATSYTHVFSMPSDCQTVLRVWDIGGRAGAITDATNAAPVVVTSASHGLNTDDIVFISGVAGNTAANGTFKITKIDDDSFSLTGSVGNADYTSGGLVAKWPEAGDDAHILLTQIPPGNSTLDDDELWFVRAMEIVVDDIDFENDLLVEYAYGPSDTGDIPDELHTGLVAYPIINLIRVPQAIDPGYEDTLRQVQYYRGEWSRVVGAVRSALDVARHKTFKRPTAHMGVC